MPANYLCYQENSPQTQPKLSEVPGNVREPLCSPLNPSPVTQTPLEGPPILRNLNLLIGSACGDYSSPAYDGALAVTGGCRCRLMACGCRKRMIGGTPCSACSCICTGYLCFRLPACLPTYIRTYIRTYVHTYAHAYIHTYLPAYIYIHIYIYIYIYIHIYIYIYIYI